MFTVIVPIYNAEKVIVKTINNILKSLKTYEYEIILVNDGSYDNTQNELSYFNDNKSIKIINQNNLGVSAARNNGIKHISPNSKYVTFIDDSDAVSENFFDNNYKILENNKNVDLAVSKIERIINGEEYGHSLNYRFNETDKDIVDVLTDYNLIHYHIGGVVFRACVFIEDGFSFDESISFWEDAKLINSIILKKRKYALVQNSKYFYDRNDKKSLSYKSWKSKDRYTKHIKDNYISIVENSIEEYGEVINYVQYLIATHYIQYIIKTNNEFVIKKYIQNDPEFLKISKNLFTFIDNKIIDELNAKTFYKKVLYRIKNLEFKPDIDFDSVEILGQKYNFLQQSIDFSLSKNTESLSNDIVIYKRGFFNRKIKADLISCKEYIEPIYHMVNRYNSVYRVRLTLLESIFNQNFLIVDNKYKICFNIKSKSLASRFLKIFRNERK